MRKLLITAAMAALSATMMPAGMANAQAVSQGDLKTAIIFNIIRFVDFPARPANAAIQLCAQRGAASYRELASLSGQRVGNSPLAYRVVDASSFSGCDIVYLGSANGSDIARARQPGTLVIGEGAGFIGAGGTIGLVRTGNQIRFEVNAKSARQSGISISSRLLRLAARVQQ